jgi:electron transfer flavoprotein alpha subunit
MAELFVVVEHRSGAIRDISFEMLFKAGELSRAQGHTLSAVLLGAGDEGFTDDLLTRSDKVIAVHDERLRHFDGELYSEVLRGLIEEERPLLTLIGNTSWGMDLAASLSIRTGLPVATDCVDILVEDGRPTVIRQVFGGKLFARVSFRESDGYIVTVSPGAFPPKEVAPRQGELEVREVPADLPEPCRQFIEFADRAEGELDISQADLLVSIGRGIGEEDNVADMRELAELLGGVLSCSRPVVDKKWLPGYHQVGSSGKSVKPKVYLAFGISGASQHLAGITGAGTVIAINKDPGAPIFRVADYGVVDDLVTVAQALKAKLQ